MLKKTLFLAILGRVPGRLNLCKKTTKSDQKVTTFRLIFTSLQADLGGVKNRRIWRVRGGSPGVRK